MIKTDQMKRFTLNISDFITLQAFYSIKPIEENIIKYGMNNSTVLENYQHPPWLPNFHNKINYQKKFHNKIQQLDKLEKEVE